MKLNSAQQEAVLHNQGPMLVLAGPGSGKTSVITMRTAHLIDYYQVPEENILVITFTRAAASEMKERFLSLRNARNTRVNFGTFHAVFFTILKHAYNLNAGNIISEETRLRYMKEIIHQEELEYEDEADFISDIFAEISLVKGNLIELDNYYSLHCPDEVFRKIYREYDRRLRRSNYIDFDDMLVLCYRLLSERADILSLWQKKFRYILIDEFQDINKVQYDTIRMLAMPENNLFIVGDDDQSIYRFRGAKPEIMLHFPNDYPDCARVQLDINYRSSGNILAAAGRLIQHNTNRYQKKIQACKDKGQEIIVEQLETLSQQNQRLTEEIVRLKQEGLRFSDMAILIRTGIGSGAMLRKLMEYNIPFTMRDNLPNLFDHFIAKDIIAYIKIAMGSKERSLFLQIINRPKRYVSRDCFDTPEVELDAVKDYYEDKVWMLERLDQLEYDLAVLSDMTPYAAVNYIRRGIGYEDYLREYAQLRKLKEDELLDVLDELQESAKAYKTYDQWFDHMEEYKEELKKQGKEAGRSNQDRLTIATMHSAKGLEYPVVFIVDANEGIAPHKKAVLPEDIEEERRLFYVAMTRAKERLYIFSSKERYNKVMPCSRFVEDLKEKKMT